MTFKKLTRIGALLLGLCAAAVTQLALAQTKVALHATQEEVNIWKQRAVNGPYLNDWNRILGRANSFRSNPTQGSWVGNQLNTSWEGGIVRGGSQYPNHFPCSTPSNPDAGNRTCGDHLRDAAFLFMLTGDTSYRDPVRTWLLNHDATPGLDFTNTTKWRTTYRDQSSDFHVYVWVRKVTYAYSYIRNTLSAGDRMTIDAWLLGAGRWFDKVTSNEVKAVHPNRDSGVYSSSAGSAAALTHYNGWGVPASSDTHESKQAMAQAAVAAVAVVVNDSALKASSKRWVKEWLRFRVFPDGTVGDQARWIRFLTAPGSPGLGYSYLTSALSHVTSIVDHLARDRDTELYTYTTSEGNGGSGRTNTAGGPKSFLKSIRRMADINLNNIPVYGSSDAILTACKRINWNVQNCSPLETHRIVQDVFSTQANLFTPDSVVKQNYMRTMPTNPTHGGYDPWGGAYGILPGARFMFGDMEGRVSPYTSESMPSPPPPPVGHPVSAPSPPLNLWIQVE